MLPRSLVALLVVLPALAFATPKKGSLVRIQVRAGATVTGEVLSETGSGFLITNGGKTQFVAFTDITSIDELTPEAGVAPAPATPAASPVPPAATPPAERKFHYEKRLRWGLIVPGASLFAAGWIIGLGYGGVVLAAGGFGSNDRQYVSYFGTGYYVDMVPGVGPIIGGLINALNNYYSYASGALRAADAVFTLGSSILQLGGLALALLGWFSNDQAKVYDDQAAAGVAPVPQRWALVPILSAQQAGLALSGTF